MPRTSCRKPGCAGTRPGPPTIADLRAWLTTVVSRLGLDRLRSAAHRRETYTGNWLPEPVVTGFDDADPLSAVVASEDARFAAMVVLERLSPDQRVAFVLHDGFAVPFAEVAEVLGTNEAAARQLASRARKAVAAQPPPEPDPSHNEVVGRLMAAMAAGDLEAVVALLHPDVTFTGDSNGKAPTAVHVIHGADKVARFIFGLARRYGPALFTAYQLGLVNGELGVYTAGCPGRRRVPGNAAADHGDDGARRKGLRPMGYRQPGQVHRLSAADSLVDPRNAARVTGIEALLGDAQRGVHPGPHVLHADLIGQLDHAGIAEAGPQVGHLLVGDGVRIGGHRVGIGDRGALVVGEGR